MSPIEDCILMAKLSIKKLNKLEDEIEFLESTVLRVGMVSNPHATSRGSDSNAKKKGLDGKTEPKTVAEILAIHETGRSPMPNSPARAPIKITMRDKQAIYGREMNAVLGKMFQGKASGELVLVATGEAIVEQFRQTVKAGLPPKLTDARKAEKRRHGKPADTPLIFGGQLQGSWRYELKRELRA